MERNGEASVLLPGVIAAVAMISFDAGSAGGGAVGRMTRDRGSVLGGTGALVPFAVVVVGALLADGGLRAKCFLATKLAAGLNHTCALMETGNVRCWGYNDFGQLGYGNKLRPSSCRNPLCLSLAAAIAFSISTSSRWVAARSISASPTAVLM